MGLPVTPNTTCDIYRGGNAPPAAPDVAGVSCYLEPQYRNLKPIAAGTNYTHVLRVATGVDIRDAYGGAPAADTIYVPDQNGTPFTVIFVARVGRNTAQDHKEVYLSRLAPTWPSSDL